MCIRDRRTRLNNQPFKPAVTGHGSCRIEPRYYHENEWTDFCRARHDHGAHRRVRRGCIDRKRSTANHPISARAWAVSYTHLRAHETPEHLVCRLLLEKKKKKNTT